MQLIRQLAFGEFGKGVPQPHAVQVAALSDQGPGHIVEFEESPVPIELDDAIHGVGQQHADFAGGVLGLFAHSQETAYTPQGAEARGQEQPQKDGHGPEGCGVDGTHRRRFVEPDVQIQALGTRRCR
ncbi:hypothetical protein ABAZ39_26500 (plasmid) [Azospirillum argentinense]|uniref:Uncharacterized protein n=1 Tax=Azospirillum argentinense TaxID=2970906 RepID=A0A060DX85_9PROT|nr:hypothetical protein ABAZ39_26500 [Azospirillum argentinense]EZQ04611.1 hypothetical protein ABAZ39_24865 [Azospirillum argentinense]